MFAGNALTPENDVPVLAVDVLQENGGLITWAQSNGQQFTKAIAFVFDDRFERIVLMVRERLDRWPDLGVRLHGEFVVDRDGNAIDAEFTRAELPSGDRPAGETHGIQGARCARLAVTSAQSASPSSGRQARRIRRSVSKTSGNEVGWGIAGSESARDERHHPTCGSLFAMGLPKPSYI